MKGSIRISCSRFKVCHKDSYEVAKKFISNNLNFKISNIEFRISKKYFKIWYFQKKKI